FAARSSHHDFRRHRQRIHRSHDAALYVIAGRARGPAVHHHLRGDRRGAPDAGAARSPGFRFRMSRSLNRRIVNGLALGLSALATAVGLLFLGAILWKLVKEGVAGLSSSVFTQMTPPPGDASGGLLNAIYG